MNFKLTFEMTQAKSEAAARAAGTPEEDVSLVALGIRASSKVKIIVSKANQYVILISQQENGYRVVKIESA